MGIADNTSRAAGFEAVLVGASAGGVEALGTLLEALPPSFPAAVLVVQHLPPDRGTVLPALLARRCARPVKEAEDKEPVQAGTVYLAPPDYHLLVEPDRTLSLSRDEAVHYSRPAIDPLFESAAMVWGERLLGIILTGASSDGAEGLRQLRACGGTAWVQDPDEAAAHVMPAAALALAGADDVLSLQQIAARLSTMKQA
ncbi:chemotaxis protein CheB [Noviherbaspirillum aridicola]|uniref:protein-glutamate methylesterase n=1 Tax=Noviherbaspirillum aridicola TaxID=2849687 RepID=A0ABQ4PZ29_9BURK|nr:chemotaxis protein CheB [Noviherbaspirillum aridicola]GIZ50109.1 chemotaxis protein CheB [Noviherbaspirillum aridicola]